MTASALAMMIATWTVVLGFTITTFVAVVRRKPNESPPRDSAER